MALGVVTYNRTTQVLLSANIEALTKNEDGGKTDKEETGNNEGTNNDDGNGTKFYYKELQGRPATYILFRNFSINGEVSFSAKDMSGKLGYMSIKIDGIMEICSDEGSGCTAYLCQTTN